MKMLLTSGGLANDSIIQSLQKLTIKPFSELKLGFIPTASNIESGDKWWLIEDLAICKQLKFKSVDIIDISAIPQKIFQARLQESDIIFIEGGNLYHLRYWLKKSGLENSLANLLKDKVYVGVSAGSMVVGPIIIPLESEKTVAQEAGDEIIEQGLGYVDFLIEPHINNTSFPELTFDYVKQEAETLKHPIYALDDNSAVEFLDGQLNVITEGNWKLFN